MHGYGILYPTIYKNYMLGVADISLNLRNHTKRQEMKRYVSIKRPPAPQLILLINTFIHNTKTNQTFCIGGGKDVDCTYHHKNMYKR